MEKTMLLEDLCSIIITGLIAILVTYPAYRLMLVSIKYSVEQFMMFNHF